MRHTVFDMQPEQSGSIDTALLGLKYLNSLSSIAAKHALEDTANNENEHKQPQQHHLEQKEQQQYAQASLLTALGIVKRAELAAPAW